MLARDRWLYHFGRALGCAHCGEQRVTIYLGTQKIPEHLSIDTIKTHVEELEAWCHKCVPKETRRTRSEARKCSKYEAAEIADLSVAAQTSSRYDSYITEQGLQTKQQYYAEWSKSHTKTGTRSFPYKPWTLQEMIEALKSFE